MYVICDCIVAVVKPPAIWYQYRIWRPFKSLHLHLSDKETKASYFTVIADMNYVA